MHFGGAPCFFSSFIFGHVLDIHPQNPFLNRYPRKPEILVSLLFVRLCASNGWQTKHSLAQTVQIGMAFRPVSHSFAGTNELTTSVPEASESGSLRKNWFLRSVVRQFAEKRNWGSSSAVEHCNTGGKAMLSKVNRRGQQTF